MAFLFGKEWTKTELLKRVGQMDQIAGIQAVEGSEGKAHNCRLFSFWTGSGLHFQVNAERALDICACDFEGKPLAWRSSAGDVHPAYYEPNGIGWLRSFLGGLLATCGLDQFGNPSSECNSTFGLHGRISNLPAMQVSHHSFWQGDDYHLEISGEVRQTSLFGENLVLRRLISTQMGSNRILITDTVSNEGYETTPHMLLYHFNLGFPLISEDTRIHIEAETTSPRDANAQKGLSEWRHLQPPTHGYQEQVFIHRALSTEQHQVNIRVENPVLGLGLLWKYDNTTLPYLMEWKMMGEGSYVLGIEPANCDGLAGRALTEKKGSLPMLEPGDIRSYQIEVEVVTTKE